MDAETTSPDAPLTLLRRVIRSAWNTLLMVYYANSMSWRFLKSGALVFFGFFLWSVANLLAAFRPSWTFLHFAMAYGAVLIIYGPIHHLVVIPVALRWRRESEDTKQELGKRLPNAGLVLFIVLVIVVGLFPVSPVKIDVSGELGGTGVDVNPDLVCVKATADDGGTLVHCHLTRSEGIDRVRVESGGSTLVTDDDPPFDFTIAASDLETVVDQRQFQVVLLDENGQTIRRYTRSLSMIPRE